MALLFDPSESDRRLADAKFQPCSLSAVPPARFSVAGLFAGIGGIELGLERSGHRCELLCEWWEPAATVLKHRFPGIPVQGDVQQLRRLPKVDLVTAGFPCTDLSQAGRTKGITGEASGLVGEVFRLLRQRKVPWVMFENVRNMLVLDRGDAMRFLVDELEAMGYRWAYRLVDSRFTGVPQRRQRVILLAALKGDPRSVLFADDEGEPGSDHLSQDAFGFYWTEGLRGLGWAQDAVPTLKGGSTVGIPSPPAIWCPQARSGRQIVIPTIEEAEQLQGFEPGWTEAAAATSQRKGTRWRLVGNAVTVGVSEWVGSRLANPGDPVCSLKQLQPGDAWPTAACGAEGSRWAVEASMWPTISGYTHLNEVVDFSSAPPLSLKGAAGFLERASRSTLRFKPGFLEAVEAHIDSWRAAA